MRLIDADGLLEDLKKWHGLDKLTMEAVIETIDKQPTAYNVDKVVKECEKQLEIYAKYHGEDWREEIPLAKVMNTVKEGGTLIESEEGE